MPDEPATQKNDSITIAGREISYGNLLFALVALLILANSFDLISSLKQIPSPLYGGDYYNGLVGVTHILEGGGILDSAQMAGELPWVPWFYHLSVAIFTKITGADAIHGLLNFSILTDIFALILICAISREFSKSDYLPAALALAFFSLGYSPVLKYSYFSLLAVIPAFGLSLYLFAKEPDMKKAAITGLFLGIVGLTNTQSFFVGFGLLATVFATFNYKEIKGAIDIKSKKIAISGTLLQNAKLFALVFGIGFALSLLFWFRPLFIYHGATPNDIQNITVPDMTQSYFLWSNIQGLLLQVALPFKSGAMLLFSLLNIAGIVYAIKNLEKPEAKFALAILIIWLAVIIHPAITIPLFNNHLVNFMLSDQIFPLAAIVFASLGFIIAKSRLEKYHPKAVALALFILLAVSYMNYVDFRKEQAESQWMKVGMEPLAPLYYELAGWIQENTNVNDVFITTNEDGFMLNALTGRKVLSYRRTHASPYINMHERMADQAVIFYGNNTKTAAGLLKKYNVKYILYSERWLLNEFQFNGEGQISGFFDPLSIPAEEEYLTQWNENSVKYLRATFPMDPAPRTGVPKYDQIVALPYVFSKEPINPALLEQFEIVKKYSANGADVFRVYRLKE